MKAIIIITLLFLFSCQTQENKDKELIESFIKEIVLNKEFSFSDTNKYLHYGKKIIELSKEKDGVLEELIRAYSKEINDGLEESNFNYKIISYKEGEKDSEVNINYHKRYLRYKSYSRVYHLVADKEIRISFIIEDDKIISFFYGLVKSENQIREPFLLNGDNYDY